jgi:tol-pal system protein YbgF
MPSSLLSSLRGARLLFVCLATTSCMHTAAQGEIDDIRDVFSRSTEGIALGPLETNVERIHQRPPVVSPQPLPAETAHEESLAVTLDKEPHVVLRANRQHAELVEQAVNPAKATPTPTTDERVKQEYGAALARFNAGDYAAALTALTEFVARHPEDADVPNAVFWQGEAEVAQADCQHAVARFETVVQQYRAHEKRPDALRELTLCEQKLGSSEKAQRYFDMLVAEYPRSEAASRLRAH